jgi:hypothetical protein
MEDGSHSEIMLCGAEGIRYLGELDIGVPQNFGIGFLPAGAKDVTTPGLQRPPIAFTIFLDVDGETIILVCNRNGKERGGAAIPLQKTTDLPLHSLFISESAPVRTFCQFLKLILKPCDKAVEYGILFLLPPQGATENEGLIGAFR